MDRATSIDDAEWTITVTEGPLVSPTLAVSWQDVYWEVRQSGLGIHIMSAIRAEPRGWITDYDGEWLTVTEQMLHDQDVPAILIRRMTKRGLI